MANKNIISVHEMVDVEANSDHVSFHPDPRILLGHTVEYSSQNINPRSSRNHFTGHSNNNFYYPNQQKSAQNYQPIANVGIGYTTAPNFTTNQHIASSSSQVPLPSGHGFMGDTMEGNGERFQAFENSKRWNKRKNTEIIPGNSYFSNVASTSSSSSSNGALQHRNRSVETGSNMTHFPQFMPSEHQQGILPMDGSYQQAIRSRPGMIRLQREPAVIYHQNHLLQGNYIEQSPQLASNTWVDHSIPSVGDAASSNGNYAHPTPALLGRSSSRAPIDIGCFSTLGYRDSSLSRNRAGNSQSPSVLSHQYHLQHLQGIHTHVYNHHQVAAPSYGHSANNNTYAGLMNPSIDPMNSSVLGFPRSFSFNVPEGIYGPHLRQAASSDHALTDAVSSEDFATMQYSGLGVENLIDHHRDMRMDIDSMTYEELLDLEEFIGDVKAGLSEEYIVKHLKTRLHLLHPSLSLSLQSPCHSLENGTCIICQVEFEEKERIGTLDCDHDYHADCIKQWLMVKNLCPICKTTALAVEKGRP